MLFPGPPGLLHWDEYCFSPHGPVPAATHTKLAGYGPATSSLKAIDTGIEAFFVDSAPSAAVTAMAGLLRSIVV